jgi:hypothetical protein
MFAIYFLCLLSKTAISAVDGLQFAPEITYPPYEPAKFVPVQNQEQKR